METYLEPAVETYLEPGREGLKTFTTQEKKKKRAWRLLAFAPLLSLRPCNVGEA